VTTSSARTTIAVAMKWVPLHVEVDPLSGAVVADARFAGASAADRAALEWALSLAGEFGAEVVVATAGPVEAEAVLRDALACGAARAVRIDAPTGSASDVVATVLAGALGGTALVFAGDHSLDRGSGSVPAFLAAELGCAQALGLVGVEREDSGPSPSTSVAVRATRRLDHGRREVLRVSGPAVLSFEGGTAELRRAPLASVLAARDATIDVVPWTGEPESRVRVTRRVPYRPRPRALPPPAADLTPRERVLSLTGALVERTPPRTVVATTDEAATLILDQLRAWGYLE
jgi:electron transfer flavoprotein beta subunit